MRKVVRALGETITRSKQIFGSTKGNRFAQVVHEDMKALIPKLSALFKKVEETHITNLSDEPSLLALSQQLVGKYEEFNAVEEWYLKLQPENIPKKKRAKTTE